MREWAPLWAAVLTVVSLASLILIVWIVGKMVVRLPANYFNGPAPVPLPSSRGRFASLSIRVGKNLLGVVLLVMGLVLMVPGIPGQGLLTFLVGLLLVEFPGKYRMERWLMRWRPLRRMMDRLRTKRGRPPFDPPRTLPA